MAFRVEFARRADNDVAAAEARIGQSAAVGRWRARLLRVVHQLETDPHFYPVADEAVDLGIDLRMAIFGRRRHVYRVLFTIDGQTVNVLRIRHAAQDRLQPGDV